MEILKPKEMISILLGMLHTQQLKTIIWREKWVVSKYILKLDSFKRVKYARYQFNAWNQGLVNLGFDDNKIRFRTNDYISSVIRQDDF